MSTNPTPSPNDTATGDGSDTAADLILPPLLVDLGRQKRRAIRDLEYGHGGLSRDLVAHAMAVCDEIDPDDPGEIVPVVLVYRCVDDGLPDVQAGTDLGDAE